MNLDIKVFNELEPGLCESWRQLYRDHGKIYNTSYEWSSTWFRHFGKDRKLFIVTGWEDGQLVMLAPLYREGDMLHAVGTGPDFLDRFSVLARHSQDSFRFIDYLIENRLKLDLRLVYPDCELYRYLMRRLDQEYVYKKDIYAYMVKPFMVKTPELQNDLKRKYKRLKRKEKLAGSYFDDELQYDFFTDRQERYIDEFIEFHLRKWRTFRSKEARDFIKDLYLNNDFVILSRLYLKNSDKSVAYSYKYSSPDKVLYSSMFGFDDQYSQMSPGLLVPYYDLVTDAYGEIDYVDFGVGSFEYKYYFANDEQIALSVKAALNWKRHEKVYRFLKGAKGKLSIAPSGAGKAKAG